MYNLVEPSDNTSPSHHLTATVWETPRGNHVAKPHQPTNYDLLFWAINLHCGFIKQE